MPKIAELREIDGAVWARVEMESDSPIELLSPEEIETNRQRESRYLDEIERLRAMLDEALYSIGTDDYEAQKILASDIKKRLVEQ